MNYLSPEVLARIRNLELEARKVVEGYLSGGHRSQQHGFAVEFAQHREYVPGDDIRHVDWKVYGRTERYYLKQYELETNLVCWLLVDSSDSMRYTSATITKYDYASLAAAALAYLVVQQNDRVGLVTFDDQIRHFLKAAGQSTHLKDIVRVLGTGPSASPSRLGPMLHQIAERINQRGIVIVISDFFDDVAEILAGLNHLRYQRHEVVVFHVLDAAEMEFPFRDSTLFHGLENQGDLTTDPLGIRESYLQEFNQFVDQLRRHCRMSQMDYVTLRTDQNVGLVLAQYLSQRLTK